jgi:phosphomannomutase
MKRRIFKWYRRRKILAIAEAEAFDFSDVDSLGEITENDAYMDIHIDEVLNLPLVM